MPVEWCLSFDLPSYVGGLLIPGMYPGVSGLTVGPGSHVEIVGTNKQRLYDQLFEFLQRVAQHGLVKDLPIQLNRMDAPVVIRHRDKRSRTAIRWNGRNATLINDTVMRPLEPPHAKWMT